MTLAGSILGCRYRHAEAGRGRADRKAGQSRVRQGRAGQGRDDRAGQGRAGQGRAGQGRAGQGRAGQGKAGHLAGDKDTHLAKMKTKGVEQAVQHHEEKEEYEHTQIVYWHHPLICDV